MKTAFVTTSYLVGRDFGGTRVERTQKFLKYYLDKPFLSFDHMIIYDNGSGQSMIKQIDRGLFTRLEILTDTHIERKSDRDFLHLFRTFHRMKTEVFPYYDKVIWFDDDCFVLSWALADWINSLESGWSTTWCPKYNFPMFSFFCICQDAYPIWEEFFNGDDYSKWNNLKDKPIECHVPLTCVRKDFISDRYGEDRIPQCADMDLYSQCPVDIPMMFQW